MTHESFCGDAAGPGTHFQIGDTVCDNERNRGIVRFIGPVAHSKKKDRIWVGVEWKLGSVRGKHDGSAADLNGKVVRYFTCPSRLGSFMKPEALQKCCTFPEAIVDRYQPKYDDTSSEAEADEDCNRQLIAQGVSAALLAKFEVVGMSKIRQKQQVQKLREVSLASARLFGAGEPNWIKQHCPSIVELDLSENFFDSWAEVDLILRQLPNLVHLNLDENDLANSEICIKGPFPSLKELILPRTGISMPKVQRLEKTFPSLEELVVGDNSLSTLSPQCSRLDANGSQTKMSSYQLWVEKQRVNHELDKYTPEFFLKGFRNLVKIDISRNSISSWSEVWRLSRLPNLRFLNASGNPLSRIFFHSVTDSANAILEDSDVSISQSSNQPSATIDSRSHLIEDFKQSVEKPYLAKEAAKEEKEIALKSEIVDVVLLNGVHVPVVEKQDRAENSGARLWTGTGTEGGASPFQFLETIMICRTEVNDWESINELGKFPCLKELYIKDSPIATENGRSSRDDIIARIGNLLYLNGSEVNDRQRTDAEITYLRRIAVAIDSKQLENSTEAIKSSHPRYKELMDRHGALMAPASNLVNGDPTFPSLSRVEVTIRSFDAESCTLKPITKKLPLTMLLKELKQALHKIFRIDSDLQSLSYRDRNQASSIAVRLETDNFTLLDYGIQNGGEIILERKPISKEGINETPSRKSGYSAKVDHQERLAELEVKLKREEISRAKQGYQAHSLESDS